jgi:GMP synthase (glutamine-hydrolysing)
MKRLIILKTGTTYPAIARARGDFDAWIRTGLGLTDADIRVVDVEHGADLPPIRACAGVIITGSHAMVTEAHLWSLRIERWLPAALDAGMPILGICYGHQLLAQSTGGQVGFHPAGQEVGTVEVRLHNGEREDALFGAFPSRFQAHVAHTQTVLRLPPGAVPLAENTHEPHHAFRVGDRAWGVQFHPEFDASIMRAYIREESAGLAAAGHEVPALLETVRETPVAAQVIERFAQIVRDALEGSVESSL